MADRSVLRHLFNYDYAYTYADTGFTRNPNEAGSDIGRSVGSGTCGLIRILPRLCPSDSKFIVKINGSGLVVVTNGQLFCGGRSLNRA
jgi:hypothetical protein